MNLVELLVPMTWPIDKNKLEDDEDEPEQNPNVMRCYRKYKLDLLEPGVFNTIISFIIKPLQKAQR